MALAKGQGGGQPSPAAQNLKQRVAFTLFPQAERGTLVLLAGGLLIAANTYTDPARKNPWGAFFSTIFKGPDHITAAPGAVAEALKTDLLSMVLVIVLAFFAATSDELGTLAVLFLAALWVGWAVNTFGQRAKSAPKSQ